MQAKKWRQGHIWKKGILVLAFSLALHMPLQAQTLIEKNDPGFAASLYEQVKQGKILPHSQIQLQVGPSPLLQPLLHWAVQKADLPLVQLLLEKGADIHAPDAQGLTPLMLAAWGNPTSLQQLRRLPLGLKQQDLHWKIQGEGFFAVINPFTGERLFTRLGAFQLDEKGMLQTEHGFYIDPMIFVPKGITDLRISPQGKVSGRPSEGAPWQELGPVTLYRFSQPAELSALGFQLFRETQTSGEAQPLNRETGTQTWIVDVSARRPQPDTQTPLSQSSLPLLQLLLEKGADPQAQNAQGDNALMMSLWAGQTEAFALLWEKVRATDPEKGLELNTALHYALWQGDYDLLRALLDKGARVPKHLQWAVLTEAARNGDHKRIAQFQQQGWALTAQDLGAETLLQAAADRGQAEVVEYLLQTGLKPQLQDPLRIGHIPLSSAARAGRLDVVQNLLRHGADLHAREASGKSLLSMAVAAGHLELVQALLQLKLPFHLEERQDALAVAAKWGDLQMAQLLLAQAIPLDAQPASLQKATEVAVSEGQLEMVRFFQAQGVSLRALNASGESLLLLAARNRQVEICQYLLDQGLDPNLASALGETPLSQAAYLGNVETLRLLLAQGAKLESRNQEGETPLMAATTSVESDNLSFLLDQGANLQSKDYSGLTVLMHAVLGPPENVRLLLERGAQPEIKNLDGKTALDLAYAKGREDNFQMLSQAMGLPVRAFGIQDWVYHGKEYQVFELIKKGADPNQVVFWKIEETSYEAPLLLWMISRADSDLYNVNQLLAQGAQLKGVVDQYGNTALHWAAAVGNSELVTDLLKQGFNPNQVNLYGNSSLVDAVRSKDVEVVDLLLKAGANPNHFNHYGSFVLMWAAQGGNLAMVQKLIAAGANLKAKNADGWTAVMTAAYHGQLEVLKTLLSRGAVLTDKDKDGWNLLMSAASGGHTEVVKYLLGRKMDPKVKTRKGETALDLAQAAGHAEVVQLLKGKK